MEGLDKYLTEEPNMRENNPKFWVGTVIGMASHKF